jgi:hypothetical protein
LSRSSERQHLITISVFGGFEPSKPAKKPES